ncbi:MAG: S8 family serine peptidase [Pseudomonadota bacterium]
MRKIRLLAPLALVLAACVPAEPPLSQSAPIEVMDDRELIVLTAPPAATLIAAAEARGYRVRSVHDLDELDDVLVVFQIPDGTTIPEAIAETEEAVPGVTAGANHLYRLQSDLRPERSYADELIGWPAGGCTAVRRVGLIDAGVVPGHPGLTDGRITQQRFVPGETPPTTNHGTLMAELLVGPGRLTETTLYSANVIDPDGGVGDAAGVVSILRSMNWLRENGVDVVNISLAGPRNKLLNRALGRAAEEGVVIVAAAGNLGPSAPPQYPAAFPFALAVTAVDRDREVYRRAVRGAHIDVAAPGVDILVRSEGALRVSSGTSMAAPVVTAVLAASPQLADGDVEMLRTRLNAMTEDLGEPGKDAVFGEGLISAPPTC